MKKNNFIPFIPGNTRDTHGDISAFLQLDLNSNYKFVNKLLFDILSCNDNTQQVEKRDLTILDLFSMYPIDIHIFFIFIEKIYQGKNFKFKINKDSFNKRKFDDITLTKNKEVLIFINDTINMAINVYQKALYRTIPITFFNKWNKKDPRNNLVRFRSFEEVGQFYLETLEKDGKPAHRQIICSLLKIAYVVASINNNSDLSKEDLKGNTILKEKLLPLLYSEIDFGKKTSNKGGKVKIQKQEKNGKLFEDISIYKFYLQGDLRDSNKLEKIRVAKGLSFNMFARIKSGISTIIKGIYNPAYNEIEDINDLIGFTGEVSSEEDAYYLIDFLYQYFFDGNGEVAGKGSRSKDILIKNKSNINYTIFEKLLNIFEKKEKVKDRDKKYKESEEKIVWKLKKNNKSYKDLKIVGTILHKNIEYKVEFKVVLVNNKNETGGYSHRAIYDCYKVLTAMIRLQGYVTNNYIKRVILNFIDKYPELLNLGGGDYSKTIQNIYDYYLDPKQNGDILKLNIPDQNSGPYFTTVDRWNAFVKIRKQYKSSTNFVKKIYPDGAQVKYLDKWLHDRLIK